MSVQRAFDAAKGEGRAALVGYLPAGFPDVVPDAAAPVRAGETEPVRPDGTGTSATTRCTSSRPVRKSLPIAITSW